MNWIGVISLGAIIFIAALWWGKRSFRALSWPVTKGKLDSMDYSSTRAVPSFGTGWPRMPTLKLSVSYEVNGISHVLKDSIKMSSDFYQKHSSGDMVPVYYDPLDPSRADFLRVHWEKLLFASLFSILGIGMLLFGLVLKNEMARKPAPVDASYQQRGPRR